jgi:hypothetical protein
MARISTDVVALPDDPGTLAVLGPRLTASLAATLLACLCGWGCGSSGPRRDLAGVQVLTGTRAGQAVGDYVPTGRLVGDTGLRPGRDGFGFDNYGDDLQVTNLTPAAVEELFGPAVCASGTGARCALIPPARAWMSEENDAMAAGHCFGMALAAARFRARLLQPTTFGGRVPAALRLAGNAPLQRTLAQFNAVQQLATVRRRAVGGTPNQILDRLIASMRPGATRFVLGLYRHGGGGHAVTPYAVEDRGDGRFAVLVYDNNYRGVTRAVSFDRRANAWKFVARSNPRDADQLYSGTASTSNLALFPSDAPAGRLPCPFCRRSDAAARNAGPAMTEIALEGDPTNHAHLLLTDARGRRTGWVRGKLVNEIPGANTYERLNAADWKIDSEPVYAVASGLAFAVTVDGSSLRGPVSERLEVIGPGLDIAAEGIKLRRGERVTVRVAGDGSRVALLIDPHHDEAPSLRIGLEGHPASWDFVVKARRLVGGSTIALKLDKAHQELDIDTRHALDTTTYDLRVGAYDVRVDRLGRRGTETFRHDNLRLPRGTFARLGYGPLSAQHKQLAVVEERGGRVRVLRLAG